MPEGGHWYKHDGTACHFQGDGKRTTLREARKQNLYPSVSGIIGLLANDGLDVWRVNTHILIAADNRRKYEEEDKDYVRRIRGIAGRDKDAILDFGTGVHDGIEQINNWFIKEHSGKVVEVKDENALFRKLKITWEYWPWMTYYLKWAYEHLDEVVASELTLVHDDGYAGTTDLLAIMKDGTQALIDWKTQNVKARATFYPKVCEQLGAYRNCLDEPEKVSLVSVVIDSNIASPFFTKTWKPKEVSIAETVFTCCLKIWQATKKYKPEVGE